MLLPSLNAFFHYDNMLFLERHLQKVCALTEIIGHSTTLFLLFQGPQGLRGITGTVGDKGEKVRHL